MGNFASNDDWAAKPSPRPRHKLKRGVKFTPQASTRMQSTQDIVGLLVCTAIDLCKFSVHHVFSSIIPANSTDSSIDDGIFDEFQIVYDDSYAFTRKRKASKDTSWAVCTPADCDTKQVLTSSHCKCSKNDDDSDSITTDSTEWLSDIETSSVNPASSVSDDFEYLDIDDDELIEDTASRLVRMASSCENETMYFLEDYLCRCSSCPQYETIETEVSNLVTWRDPEELISIIRVIQAFSTYNEAIGYHADMIATADECLQVWNGDEDQAFTSFVMLHDEVPYLCSSIV